MLQILLVAIGGALGSVGRYLAGVHITRLMGAGFPYGTLTVNIVGSFLIGLLVELLARKLNGSMDLRLFLVVGFLGGFTTFSSFSLDALALFERGATLAAAAYILASLILSLAAVFAGLLLGRSLL
ncbi:fluoride efflux transporter CrcB [Peteryoungia ipomoeae]|uniref:Fluoride-specific ion channel FluC n=1 Tax=Peteryoungia ipomoeae TaxID=1210932 RepID=A0A4S8P7C0_9HYPH|nr:fluoride efflux transporter CrcB [Peteryoungia ipomoeae]THV25345.1 fluoride efflux transporter CrcB [Peteryoungia ipomoeae]